MSFLTLLLSPKLSSNPAVFVQKIIRLKWIGSLLIKHKGRSGLLLVPLTLCARDDCDPNAPKMNRGSNWMRATSVHEFSYTDIDGELQSMDKYKGKILVIVNVASDADETPLNYKHLVALHKKYGASKDLEILAFPCNQFDKEPRNKQGGYFWFLTTDISDNFAKFLIDREGRVVKRYAPDEDPYELVPDLCKKNWFDDQRNNEAKDAP
ncbi:unnamed protein product [Allacma fusca]|uniref:Glutathione peroxidase n=1 Tax=Allacma fusca TaxID=39272 RepID=A0A8J2L987_9HEXA|nr:unnamed protein product [Allacma fusca]